MCLLVVIIGLCVGSFLNVCIYRIPREESIAYPPSHCAVCGYELKFYDLIPIFSYLFLKGKCRKCRDKISFIYPVVEILNALIYLVLFIKYSLSFTFIFYALLSSLLIVISIIDIKTKEIYSMTTIFGLIIGGIYILSGVYFGEISVLNKVLGGFVGYGIIYLIVVLTHGMGAGDADIAGICGLFIGLKGILVTLFLAVVMGGAVASVILILKMKDKKSEIAFGPYIALGAFIWIIIGEQLLTIYSSFFL